MRTIAAVVAVGISLAVGESPSSAFEEATPRRGGSVAIAFPQEPPCLSLLVTACAAAGIAYQAIVNQVLEGAYEVAPDLTYRPNLVSRATVTKRPFTVTYHIRPTARWSDGVPVTAADFVFTFDAFLRTAGSGSPWGAIRRVRALGPKTARAVFRAPVADWREFFHTILPRHALVGESLQTVWRDTIDNPKTGRPIASGPFLVERLQHGRNLTLARNPRYWGPHTAYLDRLVFRFGTPDEAAGALRRGDVDLIYAGGPLTQAAVLDLRRRPSPGVRVVAGPATNWEHLEILIGAGGHPALRNRLVRKALAYGVDRKAITRTVLGQLMGERRAGSKPLDSVVFLSSSPFYRRNWGAYRYRPAEARRLLEQAGCRRGLDGIYACAGERLSLRFVTTAGSENRERTLKLVQTHLRRVGIEAKLEYAPGQAFFGTVLRRGDFDVALFSWVGSSSLAGSYFIFACGAINNFTGYCNRSISRELLRSTGVLKHAQRVRALNRIDTALARDVPVIPLFQGRLLTAFRASLTNVRPSDASGEDTIWNAEDWWLAR